MQTNHNLFDQFSHNLLMTFSECKVRLEKQVIQQEMDSSV